MSYRWVEHTAELKLEIEAPGPTEVFGQALAAIGELLGDGATDGERVRRSIELSAGDRSALLVAWLDELVYLAETQDLVPLAVDDVELTEAALRASATFARGAPRHLVKGATYHRLRFEPSETGYRATVVLDV